MSKPTYYLWKTPSMTEENLNQQKQSFIKLGFRVVVFRDGDGQKDINEAIKAVIQNHINDNSIDTCSFLM